MKFTLLITTLLTTIIFLPVLKSEMLDLKDASPGIVESAKLLGFQRNYAGMDRLIEELDSKYQRDYGLDYFRSLMAISEGFFSGINRSEQTYADVWYSRKLKWKFLLTPNSYPQDTFAVQTIKNVYILGGVSSRYLVKDFDENQFVALRHDGVALLKAYADSLRARIIPNYVRKTPHGGGGAVAAIWPIPTSTAEEQTEKKSRDEQFTKNEYDNNEQDELNKSLGLLSRIAEYLILNDFAFPPVDDAAVEDLLETYKPDEGRERVLFNLDQARKNNLRDLAAMKKNADSLQQLAQPSPSP